MELVFPRAAGTAIGRFLNEEFFEELGRSRDGRDSHARFRPGDLAPSVDAVFATDRERREARLCPDLVGDELINRDVSIGTILRLGMQHAGKKGMHREVSALDPVVETAVDGQVFAVGGERLEQRRQLVALTRPLGEEGLLLKAEEIPHRHKTPSSHARTLRRGDRSVGTQRTRQERRQAGQGERGVKGAQHKTASVEALGHGGKVVWIARHRNRYGPRPAHAIKLPEECALSLHFEYNRRAGLILNRSRPFDRELPFSFLRPRRGPEPRLPSTGARRKLPPRAP